MCKVKTGSAVCDWQDVQNLITGIIFRQVRTFLRDDLANAVDLYLDGSPMRNDKSKVQDAIDSTLSIFVCNDWLVRRGSEYMPILRP